MDVFVHFYDGVHEEGHDKIIKEWAEYIKLMEGHGNGDHVPI